MLRELVVLRKQYQYTSTHASAQRFQGHTKACDIVHRFHYSSRDGIRNQDFQEISTSHIMKSSCSLQPTYIRAQEKSIVPDKFWNELWLQYQTTQNMAENNVTELGTVETHSYENFDTKRETSYFGLDGITQQLQFRKSKSRQQVIHARNPT